MQCVCVDGLHSNYSPKPGGSNKDWKTDPLVGIPSPTSSVCFPRFQDHPVHLKMSVLRKCLSSWSCLEPLKSPASSLAVWTTWMTRVLLRLLARRCTVSAPFIDSLGPRVFHGFFHQNSSCIWCLSNVKDYRVPWPVRDSYKESVVAVTGPVPWCAGDIVTVWFVIYLWLFT